LIEGYILFGTQTEVSSETEKTCASPPQRGEGVVVVSVVMGTVVVVTVAVTTFFITVGEVVEVMTGISAPSVGGS